MYIFKNPNTLTEKTDIFAAIDIQREMLLKTGAFPLRRRPRIYNLRLVICFFFDISLSCMCVIELVHNIRQKDWKHLTELLSFVATDISYLSKYTIFLTKSKHFLNIINQLNNPLFRNYPLSSNKHVFLNTRYTVLLMRTYQFVVCGMIVLYTLKPWFTDLNTAIRFEAFELGVFQVPVHLWQMVAILVGIWNNTTLDVLALGLIGIATAQFQILCDKLENLRKWAGYSYEEIDRGVSNADGDVDEKIDRKVAASVKECVIHHMAIIKYTTALEEMYNYYFLFQFGTSVAAICNTWFQFITARDDFLNTVFLGLYSIALATQLMIYCSYGNNLTVRSEEVRDACYQSEWYNFNTSVKKSLLLIMERSKRPTYLTAGKFAVLGLVAYTSLMQSSYSYFTLMNHMYGN